MNIVPSTVAKEEGAARIVEMLIRPLARGDMHGFSSALNAMRRVPLKNRPPPKTPLMIALGR